MRVIDRRVVIPHEPGRAPVVHFVNYVHPTKPVLLRRHGWEISNDIHDEMYELRSEDNGATWGERQPVLGRQDVDGGHLVFTEAAAVYLPRRDRFVVVGNRKFEPSLEGCELGQPTSVYFHDFQPDANPRPEPYTTDFGFRQGICVSFAHPIEDSRERVLVPLQVMGVVDDDRRTLHGMGLGVWETMPGVMLDYGEVRLAVGTFDAAGTLHWRIGDAVPLERGLSSRGLYEGTVAELSDGRLAMVCRGSNHAWPDRPGFKWLSFSRDGGRTWGDAQPLRCHDGSTIESGSSGSLLFRAASTGRLYFVGNLCLDGQRPNGNMPRSPLAIAEVQEEPFALRRDTITVIDRAQPHEHPDTQHSNFKLYEDRQTGDAVIYLTRYGERGYENDAWLNADHYAYRVALAD